MGQLITFFRCNCLNSRYRLIRIRLKFVGKSVTYIGNYLINPYFNHLLISFLNAISFISFKTNYMPVFLRYPPIFTIDAFKIFFNWRWGIKFQVIKLNLGEISKILSWPLLLYKYSPSPFKFFP